MKNGIYTLLSALFLPLYAYGAAAEPPSVTLPREMWVSRCGTQENTGGECAVFYLPARMGDTLKIVPDLTGGYSVLYIDLSADVPKSSLDALVRVDNLLPHPCDRVSHDQLLCGSGTEEGGLPLTEEMLRGRKLHVHYATADGRQVSYTLPLMPYFPIAYSRYQASDDSYTGLPCRSTDCRNTMLRRSGSKDATAR